MARALGKLEVHKRLVEKQHEEINLIEVIFFLPPANLVERMLHSTKRPPILPLAHHFLASIMFFWILRLKNPCLGEGF